MPPPKGGKGGRRPGAGRKPLWRSAEERRAARGVYIGAHNVRRWILLKESQGFVNDPDFASYLLDLAEEQPAPQARQIIETKTPVTTINQQLGENLSIMYKVNMDRISDGDYDYDEEDSVGDDDEDDDWRPSSCRQARILKRPARGKRKKSEGQRQTRSQSRVTDSSEEREKIYNTRKPLPTPEISEAVKEDKIDTSKSNAVIRMRVCLDCGQKHLTGDCPLHKPVHVILDCPWCPEISEPDAEATLPKILKLETVDKIHGPSVFTIQKIEKYTQFGPLIGKRVTEAEISEEADLKYIWEIFGKTKLYLDTSDRRTSNWLRFIRPAPTREEHNIIAVTHEDALYFVSVQEVEAGGELLYWADDPTINWSKKKMEKTSCGGCNQKFHHPLYYRMHCMIFHDPNFSLTIRKYHCKVCGVAVLGKENIMKHAVEMHEGKGAYQCQYCKKFFLRLHSLDTHVSYSCKLNPWKTHPLCETCGKKFCQPQHLRAHIKRMHSDMSEVLKEFQCKNCLKLLGSRAALQRHLKEVHNKDQNIAATCDRCGKTFQNKSNLKIHMLTHSGVKPFRCSETGCTAAFTTKQCLQFHYKKVHGYGMHNMPPIERCVAYTFESYSGGLITYLQKKELRSKMKQDNELSSSKPSIMTAADLVRVSLSTMDSSLSSSNPGGAIKQEEPLPMLDSPSENSTVDSQPQDDIIRTTATHTPDHSLELDSPAQQSLDASVSENHHDHMLQDTRLSSCSPKEMVLSSSNTVGSHLFSKQAATIERQARLLALGLTARSMLDGREHKSKDDSNGNSHVFIPDLQQLEQTLDMSRHGSDLSNEAQYTSLALCLARQRAGLISSGIPDHETKNSNLNHSDKIISIRHHSDQMMDLNQHGDHSMNLSSHNEHGLHDLNHHSKHDQDIVCKTEHDLDISHHSTPNAIDVGHCADHGLEMSRQNSDQHIPISCHSDISINRHSENSLGISHHSEHGLDLVHHSSHGLELSHHVERNLELSRQHSEQLELRRHAEHELNLAHHAEHDLELIHHSGRPLHIDISQHVEHNLALRSRSEHELESVHNIDMEPNPSHRLDISPHTSQLPSPLRREHMLDLAARHSTMDLAHPMPRSGHLVDHQRHHSDQHHNFSVGQHRPDLASPSPHHQDQSLDMSRRASNLSSPDLGRQDLGSPLSHQDNASGNLEISRQTDTPMELTRPPSHSIDLTTGRPTPLALDINRPPSHSGRQMAMDLGHPSVTSASEQLSLDPNRMMSPGYQAYSPPMYQSAPPAHMPPPSPTVHSSYHTYPGYY